MHGELSYQITSHNFAPAISTIERLAILSKILKVDFRGTYKYRNRGDNATKGPLTFHPKNISRTGALQKNGPPFREGGVGRPTGGAFKRIPRERGRHSNERARNTRNLAFGATWSSSSSSLLSQSRPPVINGFNGKRTRIWDRQIFMRRF